MSNGRSLETADNTQEVDYTTGYRFQFEAESNRIYIAFAAIDNDDASSEDAGKSPAFAAQVYLRSFLVEGAESDETGDSST